MSGPKGESLAESQNEQRLSLLMRKVQEGDFDSYSALLLEVQVMVESYVKNSFYRFRNQVVDGHQQDLVQDILLALHTKRHTYDPSQYFLPWVYAISRYKVIDFLRTSKRRNAHVELDEEELVDHSALIENVPATIDTAAMLKTLPEKQRKILEMVKLEGLSIAEAAKRTGFSQSDIKITIHRAIKTLQSNLKRQ